MNNEAVQDWLRVRRLLLEMEASFTSLAVRVAGGEVPEAVLLEQRVHLEGMRELCTAAYEKAFPPSVS